MIASEEKSKDLENQIQLLITTLQNFKISNNNNQIQESKYYQRTQNNNSDLGKKDKEIFEFIADNQDIHQEGIVEHFKTKTGFSRMPVLKLIKELEEDGYIIRSKKGKGNVYSLRVNENNVLLIVKKEMDDFKKKFSILLKKLKKEIIDSMKNEEKEKMLSFLHKDIYEKLVLIYMFRAIFAWSNKIKDEQTLYNLYQIVISNIIEIQLEYNKFGNRKHVSLLSIPYDHDICIQDDDRDEKIQIFKNKGLEKETRSLLSELDRINYRYSSLERLMRNISN